MKIIVHKANGLQIGQRREDGYINVTALSKAHYKATKQRRDTSHWLALERTKQSIEHLSRLTEISVDQLIVKVKTGRNEYRGTYIHPRLAVRFGIWLSDDFGYMVEEWVSQWMTTGKQPLPAEPTEKEIEPEIAAVLDELERLIISLRSHARTIHTGSHQPVDALLFKSVHHLSHNQLSLLAATIRQLEILKQFADLVQPQKIALETTLETAIPQVEPAAPSTPELETPANNLLKSWANFTPSKKEPTIRFTVDLPESLHRRLSLATARTGMSKADVVRMLLEDALKDVKD